MSEFERQQSQTWNSAKINPAKSDQTTRAEYPAQKRAWSNQTAQRFVQSCPLRLPGPGACPFGGACHACPAPVQAKLQVNEPGDEYEQEADRVADQVMRMPHPYTHIQRACPTCDEEESVQTKPLAGRITPLVQRQVEPEEEEPLQTKLGESAMQRQEEEPEDEEEEPVQTKLTDDAQIQRQEEEEPEDEEEAPVQAKLTDGAQIQRQEEEEPEEEPVQAKLSESAIQRQEEEPEDEEEEPVQTKPTKSTQIQRQEEEPEEEEEPIQTKQGGGQTPQVGPGLATQIRSLKGGGQPLPPATRGFFEPRFGRDFGQVRVHTGPRASKAARALNARAFTVGQDVVLGAGQYAPETAEGNKLLAHELTHVVQQADTPAGNTQAAVQRQTWGRYHRAEDIYGANKKLVRPLTDANFPIVFHHRSKVLVIEFWAKWCRPCDSVAKTMVSLAKRCKSGPYADLVKFYHIEWDPKVNPKLRKQFAFSGGIPVVYFYYATGDPRKRLLKASPAGIKREEHYMSLIKQILRQHGHAIKKGRAKGRSSLAPEPQSGSRRQQTSLALNLNADGGCIHRRLLGDVTRRKKYVKVVLGRVLCQPPVLGWQAIKVHNFDRGCTRPATKVHEETHKYDIRNCCQQWRAWVRPKLTWIEKHPEKLAQTPGLRRGLFESWWAWPEENEHYLESRAYWNGLKALKNLWRKKGCTDTPTTSCCKRIRTHIAQVTKKQWAHHKMAKPLTPCDRRWWDKKWSEIKQRSR